MVFGESVCSLMPMEGFQANPLSSCLPDAEAPVCRSAKEVAGVSRLFCSVKCQCRDGSISWAHQKAQVHIRLQR